MTTPAVAVQAYGQSIWLDEVRRGLLTSGAFARLIADAGVRGATANPTIFQKAIATGTDYDAQMTELLQAGLEPDAVFDQLAVRDLQQVADLLRPVYEASNGTDGFVSWEVSPALAADTERTLTDARRLWRLLDRPNGMVKIPGTAAGVAAVYAALTEGINVNVTLLFSVTQHAAVMDAYLRALEQRLADGKPLATLHSVASFFVSRVDVAIDRLLDQQAHETNPGARAGREALRSRAGIANAKVAYARFQETFRGPRWDILAAHGANVQRPLWASTGTKDPRLSDTFYVDALIGPDTVNTVPLATLAAFNDHGTAALTLTQGLDEAQHVLTRLAHLSVDLSAVTAQLEEEGIRLFAEAFASLREGIAEQRAHLVPAARRW
jgi:transaldolase